MPLSETLRKIRESPTPPNEETAKMRILVPILRELGWDSLDQDVLWEYQLSRNRGRVDAVLMGAKRPAAFIEAKAPGQRLDDHVEQVLGYAFQEGANICALTTGLEWWLYLPAETDYNFDERRFAELRLKDDPVEQLATDFAAFLSKETLLDGEAEKKAKQVLKARREAEHLDKEVPGIWSEMLSTPDEELIELVSKRVYEKTNLRPTSRQVANALKGRPTTSATNPPQPINTPTNLDANQHNLSSPSRSYSKIPQTIDLFGQNYEIKYWADIIRIVVDYLFEQGADFNKALDMSGITLTIPLGYKKDYYEVDSTEIYVYTSWGSNATKHAHKLLERFGYSADELVLNWE